MSGPEHYREAERLIADWREAKDGGEGWPPPPITPVQLSEAQVHATPALAAATALNDADGGTGVNDWNAWNDAASVNGRPNGPEVSA